MFGSKIICNVFFLIKDKLSSFYFFVKNIPNLCKSKIFELINYYKNLKYKLTNLYETNLQLGIEHLYNNHLNDAIIRFKLIDKFLSPNDHKVNYWLGWTYFLKNNYEKSIYYFENSLEVDKTQIGVFLKHYKDYKEINPHIWCQYRDLIAKHYTNNLHNDKLYLPYNLVQGLLDKITDIPDNYDILELGSNVGVVGYEIKKRFPDEFTLTGIECSTIMSKLVDIYYHDVNIYDELLIISIQDFIKSSTSKFNVILSFCSLSFTKNLKDYFESIYLLLNDLGYFAFCLPIDDNIGLSLKRKEFIFKLEDIKAILNLTRFVILDSLELELAKNNKYCMVFCKKINNK